MAQFTGPGALQWAQEDEPDMDEDGNLLEPDTFILPPLPFTASAKADRALARKIRTWIKECLSAFSVLLLELR